MNLSSDLYQIAEESHHVGSKTESGKDNAAHADVTTWHYFLTDLVYVEADGTEIECYMNIDVKQNDSGHWFYSFAIEKGSRPADVLSVVTDKSATTSTISITETQKKATPLTKILQKKLRKSVLRSLMTMRLISLRMVRLTPRKILILECLSTHRRFTLIKLGRVIVK